ncbi:tetratricopeptide repeat protein [Thermodesulfobacteriota bacterium]
MFFKEKFWKKAVLLLPFAFTMFVIPATLLMADGSSFSISNIEHSMKSLTSTSAGAVSRWDYLFTQFGVIVIYIRLLFFPINQNLDYDYPIYHSFFTPHVFLPFLFLLWLFFFGLYCYYRSEKSKAKNRYGFRLISFGILWFFITLSVESSIIVLRNVIFEHRLYLPSVGFIICFLAAISMATNAIKNKTTVRFVISGIVVAVFILAGMTYARNSVWQNNIVLWEDVVSKSPQKARSHHNLGVAYAKKGRTEDAIKEYIIAIEIEPESAIAHNDLALAYAAQGRLDDAQKEHMIAGKLKPGFVKAHNNLGFSYMKQGRKEEAIREYLLAIKINPDNFEAHNNLGILFAQKELFDEALREFQAASAIAPNNVSVRKNIETIMNLNK